MPHPAHPTASASSLNAQCVSPAVLLGPGPAAPPRLAAPGAPDVILQMRGGTGRMQGNGDTVQAQWQVTAVLGQMLRAPCFVWMRRASTEQ